MNEQQKTAVLEALNTDLNLLASKIERLEAAQNGGYTAQVAKSFHLGMVGGSGRNVASLNRRRGAELDRTIERAKQLTDLYKQRNAIETKIKDINENGEEKRQAQREEKYKALAEWWKALKVGDDICIRPDCPVLITKKNKKSAETESGCIWKAADIIGKKAAELL